MLKRGILTLSVLSSFALASVVPIAQFKILGNTPSSAYDYTGVAVDSKIYMFGGAYNVKVMPYMVDPITQDPYNYRMPRTTTNITDLSYAYDFLENEWKFETKTPIPWHHADSIVSDTNVYFFNIGTRKGASKSKMYKYDTLTKNWSQKSDLPFLWESGLASCYSVSHGKIYFTAREKFGLLGRTIIYSFDVSKEQWDERIIFTKKKLAIDQLICTPESFKVIGRLYETNLTTGEIEIPEYISYSDEKRDLFTLSYDGNEVTAHNVYELLENRSYNYGNPFEQQVSVFKEYVLKYITENEKASLHRLNTITLENEVIEANLPYNFSQPLILPVNEDEIILLGGNNDRRVDNILSSSQRKDTTTTITQWHHKVIKDNIKD